MDLSRTRRRPDLGLRISIYLALLLTAVTVSVSALVIRAQRTQLRYHAVEQGRAIAALAAESARLAVFSESHEDLRRILGTALVEEGVLDVCAFGEDGRLLARAGTGGRPLEGCGLTRAALPWWGRSGAGYLEEREAFAFWAPVQAEAPPSTEEALHFGAAEPGPVPLVTTGYVVVRFSTATMRQAMRQSVVRSVGVGLLFLLLGGAVAHRIVHSATQPLRELAATVRARGTPIGVPADEVGLLAGTYSALLDSLERAFADLQALRDALEEKVAERTAELREARNRLEERVAERTSELDATYRQLMHAEKLSAAGRMATSVAHEFNNPVQGIRSVLRELAGNPGLGPEDRDLAHMAIGECDRLGRLVRDLQKFSRPTSGRAIPLDLGQVVQTMIQLCGKEFRRKGITVETHFGDDVPPVSAVEDQVKQVVLNLLTNAGDAMAEDGGAIRVSTEHRGAEVELRVEDTGRGIPPEIQERIFDPFFTTKSAVKGTGLGLSVSYGIVRRHGGRIEVESEPGAGAAFTVILPIEGATEL